MSGTTFAGAFAMLYTFLFVLHLAMDYVSLISFWTVGLLYFAYAMFCLITYRSEKELCFYCKFAGI